MIFLLKAMHKIVFDEVILEIVEEIVMLLIEMKKESLIQEIPMINVKISDEEIKMTD